MSNIVEVHILIFDWLKLEIGKISCRKKYETLSFNGQDL